MLADDNRKSVFSVTRLSDGSGYKVEFRVGNKPIIVVDHNRIKAINLAIEYATNV